MQKIILDNLEEIGQQTLEMLKGPIVALSGGSTYKALLGFWAAHEKVKSMSFFPVDERLVGFDEEGNNWRVAYDNFFVPAGITEQKDHLATGAEQFEALLKEEVGDPIVIDQVFLGMGDDGHTASLFPGGEYLDDHEVAVLETTSPKPPFPRVSLGLKSIWAASELIVVIPGANKASLVQRLLDGDTSLPITLAVQGHPDPILFLDRAAAGE